MTATETILLVWNLVIFLALVASIRANRKWVALNDQLMRERNHPWFGPEGSLHDR